MAGTASTNSERVPVPGGPARPMILKDNLQRVRERIAAAAERCGRSTDDIHIVAVTKSVEVDIIRMAIDLGLLELAENRVQALAQRAAMIQESAKRKKTLGGEAVRPRWHMIGHLQRNKVKALLKWTQYIHSMDSLRLAEDLSEEAVKQQLDVDVLLQINVSGEKSKFGLAVGAIDLLCEQIAALPGLRLAGLMTMAPIDADARELHGVFGRLRELAEDLRTREMVSDRFRELSMGMSQDFEIAIEEGATQLRLGSVLFEGLAAKRPDQ